MANKRSTKNRKQIKRTTRHFQLRTEHPVDQHVGEILDYAKSQRREVTLIREAITLYWALEQGNLEALFEVFPQYKASFGAATAEALEQFMQILKQQVIQPKKLEEQPAGQSGPKQLAAPSFAMPVFEEDDEPTMLIRASASTDSSMNFVTALRSMQ